MTCLKIKIAVFKSNRDHFKRPCDPAEGALNHLDLIHALLSLINSVGYVVLFATKMEDTREQSCPERTILAKHLRNGVWKYFWFYTVEK